jgi:hypothetical protein
MRIWKLGIALVLCGIASGCTSVKGYRTLPDDVKTEGIRYWLPAPYLFVSEPIELGRTETFVERLASNPLLIPFQEPKSQARSSGSEAESVSEGLELEPKKPAPVGDKEAKEVLGVGGTGAKEAGEEVKKPVADLDTSEPETPPGLKGRVEIVWLPDHCQQYALQQRTVLASSTNKFTLAEGWRLSQVDTQLDSTKVAEQVIGLFSKKLELDKEAEEDLEPVEESGNDKQPADKSPARVVVKRTVIQYLQPGLYPVFTYKAGKDGCTEPPTLAPLDAANIRTTVLYSKPEESAP